MARRTVNYKTQGTCSQFIEVTVDDNDVIEEVTFYGGCNGGGAICAGLDSQQVKNLASDGGGLVIYG